MNSGTSHRDYLLRVMRATGLTQTQLAHRAGLDPSTLSRFLAEGRTSHELRASTLRKIEQATGVPVDPAAPVHAAPGFAEAEAVPLAVESHSTLEKVIATLAATGANIDPWTLQSPALEGAGYRPGDILLVALGETPVPGDVICAQIYDWSKGRAETLFRLYQPPYLVAATSNPEFLRPYIATDAHVAIKGVVLHAIRSRAAQNSIPGPS